MSAEKGSAFLLKIGDGGAPPVFATVAGMRTTQLSVNGEAVNVTNKGSGGWRELLSGAGVRSVSVAGSGIFTGSAAEGRVKTNALAGVLDDYELSFESGERLRGRFLVARLDYAGDYNGERTYALNLESSGEVVTRYEPGGECGAGRSGDRGGWRDLGASAELPGFGRGGGGAWLAVRAGGAGGGGGAEAWRDGRVVLALLRAGR